MNVFLSWRAGRDYPAPNAKKFKRLASFIAGKAASGIPDDGSLSISFVSPKEMAEINEEFLSHHGDTDVICFDYRQSQDLGNGAFEGDDDGEMPQVEIIICPAVAAREAAKRLLAYQDELILYLAHGLLHAAGYDDLQVKLKRLMRAAEKRVMKAVHEEFDTLALVPPCKPHEGRQD